MSVKYLQYLKQYLKRKQIIALIVVVVIVVSAAFIASQIRQPQPEAEFSSLTLIQFKIEPEEFKVTENGTLFLKVMNEMENATVKCDYYFETHDNVKLYLGADLLPKSGNNYTHTKFLDPKERSYLEFTVVASLDIGDDKRSYYIKVYIYANDVFVGLGDIDFWVKRD